MEAREWACLGCSGAVGGGRQGRKPEPYPGQEVQEWLLRLPHALVPALLPSSGHQCARYTPRLPYRALNSSTLSGDLDFNTGDILHQLISMLFFCRNFLTLLVPRLELSRTISILEANVAM